MGSQKSVRAQHLYRYFALYEIVDINKVQNKRRDRGRKQERADLSVGHLWRPPERLLKIQDMAPVSWPPIPCVACTIPVAQGRKGQRQYPDRDLTCR